MGVAGAAVDSAWPGLAAVAALAALSWRRPAPAAATPDAPPIAPPREEVHPVSGLPTREPLLATMAADARGTLGVLAFRDYDRLCAFDPQAGDRVLRVLADRVRAMLPPSRTIAHVDRGHLAIWIDAALAPDAAERELKAAVYALGTLVADDSGAILPEVALRHVAFDRAAETADVALARTIASFAVVDLDGDAAPAQQVIQARDRFLLEQDLRQALARAELRLAYQPLIDAGEGRVCGAEALLRWDRAGGAVPPAQFVPIMESAGLARDIGLWVMNAALRQTADWAQPGLSPLRIAVNVSGQQMTDDDLPAVVARMLARHGIPADALEVELTESVALDDTGQAARLVRALRTQGVAVAIDDFGTGFSSLSTMRRLTFDKIKIDREFVTDVHRRRESQAICQSVIALGRGLGIRVLAEGVEQRAEVEWLRRHGCRYFQGYYFSRPLAPADFASFAADTGRLAILLADDVASLRRDIVARDSVRFHA
ncbi:hypothetical protein ASG29_00700 [Sphingomonas sp. Leaf412]|nr:hypothetical protein ASG29_00700 [Sphingomonas sp. Leaf412]